MTQVAQPPSGPTLPIASPDMWRGVLLASFPDRNSGGVRELRLRATAKPVSKQTRQAQDTFYYTLNLTRVANSCFGLSSFEYRSTTSGHIILRN